MLFDLEHTLVELFTAEAAARLGEELGHFYERALGRGAAEAAARAVVHAAPADPYHLWSGVHRALAARDQGRAAQLSHAATAVLGEHESAAAARLSAGPLPGVADTLAWLEAQGVALAVATAVCQPAVRTALHRAGILTRFDVLVARTPELGALGRGPEPGPFPLRHALRDALAQLGCGPGEAVYVAGGVPEVRAGRAAGIATVGVTPAGAGGAAELRGAGAVAVLDTLAGLRGLLHGAEASLAATPPGAA